MSINATEADGFNIQRPLLPDHNESTIANASEGGEGDGEGYVIRFVPEDTTEHGESEGHGGADAAEEEDDASDAEFEPTAAAYGVERERYLVLLGLCLVNGANNLLWMTYATIVTPTESYYGITNSDINTLSISAMAVYIGMFWLSGVVLPKMGLGWGLVACAALNVFVCVLRLITVWDTASAEAEEGAAHPPSSSSGYPLILAGNLIGGVCQVLVMAAPPMCSNQWFALEERNFATGIGVAALVFGGALGALLPAQIVTDPSGDRKEFQTLYWVQLAIAMAGVIVCVIAKKQPTLPPTAAAFKLDENVTRRSFHHQRREEAHHGREGEGDGKASCLSSSSSPALVNRGNATTGVHSSVSFRSGQSAAFTLTNSLLHPKKLSRYLKRAVRDIYHTVVKAIFTNGPFLLIVLLTGLVQGSLWVVATLIMQLLQPFGVSQATVGWIGFAGQIAGGVASVGIGGVLAHFADYKPVLVALIVLCAVVSLVFPCTALIMGVEEVSTLLATVLGAVLYIGLCFFCFANVPIAFELGIEVTFPLSEEITSPLIMWAPSVFSLVAVQGLGVLLTDTPTRERAVWAMLILGGFVFVSIGLSLLLKLKYKRREYEQAHAQATAEVTTPETENGVPIAK